jgi:hypothetical protein
MQLIPSFAAKLLLLDLVVPSARDLVVSQLALFVSCDPVNGNGEVAAY